METSFKETPPYIALKATIHAMISYQKVCKDLLEGMYKMSDRKTYFKDYCSLYFKMPIQSGHTTNIIKLISEFKFDTLLLYSNHNKVKHTKLAHKEISQNCKIDTINNMNKIDLNQYSIVILDDASYTNKGDLNTFYNHLIKNVNTPYITIIHLG